jgi:hypothetical protein
MCAITFAACNSEDEQPKVTYVPENTPENIPEKIDSTEIVIADLPIHFDNTKYLIHPVGDVRIYEGRSKSSYGSSSVSRVSYSISNYNRFEITGYLHNLYFQHLDSLATKPLTNQKMIIQTATYLNTIAELVNKDFIVYTIADKDTNRDGIIDFNDIKALYMSEVSGTNFMKLTPDLQELIDWSIVEIKNRLYFRTIEDTNKNGDFDKNDNLHYYFVDLASDLSLNEYTPY